jgi:hypothetical protein
MAEDKVEGKTEKTEYGTTTSRRKRSSTSVKITVDRD